MKEKLKFGSDGLMPCIIQDYYSNEVLMLGYMNDETLAKTRETGLVHFWSRSRDKLWLKGSTSGHYQHVKTISVDCDRDTLLIKVLQDTAACHTGNYSCFFTTLSDTDGESIAEEKHDAGDPAAASGMENMSDACAGAGIIDELYDVVAGRKKYPKEGSYTSYLFEKGLDKILKKVGEEASEVIIAAKNTDKSEIRYETADLIYHLLVLMAEKGLTPKELYTELRNRRK
jgi:phosphoribosyl-AMP cyclohydrolase / phosphoribosyl-ATP pyrophosphohydrolase